MWGKDLLRKGLCWRVGNGHNIRAHQDPWIPNLQAYISICKPVLNLNCKVDRYLLDNGMWNEQVVRKTFSVFEAEAILDIPLNQRGCEDARYWIGSKYDKYSLKAGYHLEVNSAALQTSQSALPDLS